MFNAMHKTKELIMTLMAAAFLLICGQASGKGLAPEITELWGGQTYSSFTSLIKFQGRYYISFREGEGHVFGPDGEARGKVRILQSKDGRKWKSVYLGEKEGYDLRDPKLSITPDGRLMVIMGGSIYRHKVLEGQEPQVCFSSDGTHYSDPEPVIIDGQQPRSSWVWRVTWHEGVGYGVDYGVENGTRFLRLLSTTDGIHFRTVTNLDVPGFPNETTVRFTPEGKMALMVRRDDADGAGYWAVSEAPYTQWKWQRMEMRLGGQDFLFYGDVILASTRSYYIPSRCKTIIMKGNASGRFEEVMVLPSGGDTSYPGLLVEGDELWVSYYSTHASPMAKVYLARIPLKALGIEPQKEKDGREKSL